MAIKTTKDEPTEQETLIKEKIALAKKLGIWGSYKPVAGFESAEEFNRIKQIDQRLTEIING
ncbi:hypothetical protein [Paenibacillus sp. FSL L8-0708]|uniref:hypothetical protein n=1 Tax=Paenibacillus sp. FSL L8-0708 TaxID=2975311 RepID=UPI0030F67A8E